ncbi:hypothetical protein CAEBREN_25411 [Caenorhabditis brenneri]|uniref:NTF2-like domain-containing protein n=1 Tax=Caenorhabditis brenneri TaxID=135651 RepID=G0N049_CAEBE|nr:hypothetical protein CAEBREN_25411 [Caenorhabditis brenneri]
MKYLFFIVILTILTQFSSSSNAPDDSIKYIQEWADGLQAAVKNGDKPAIKSFFYKNAIFLTCEHTNSSSRPYEVKSYRGENLVDLLAKPNPKFGIHVLSSHYYKGNEEHAVAFLVITGFGDPIAHTDFFFNINETAQFVIGEYLACGWAKMNCRKVCE